MVRYLTVPTGGTTGIPTDITKTFSEFRLTIQNIHSDEFNGWTFGQLQPIDSFTSHLMDLEKYSR